MNDPAHQGLILVVTDDRTGLMGEPLTKLGDRALGREYCGDHEVIVVRFEFDSIYVLTGPSDGQNKTECQVVFGFESKQDQTIQNVAQALRFRHALGERYLYAGLGYSVEATEAP